MESNKTIRQFAEGTLTNAETDQFLSSHITNTLETELKQRFSQTLQHEHGVHRDLSGTKPTRKRLGVILAVAASIVMLIALSINFFTATSSQELAQQYIAQNELLHPASFKGTASQDTMRKDAILAFNEKNYAAAAKKFQAITAPTQEDIYYLGLSQLMDKDYDAAIDNLERSIATQVYREEANWYLALTYLFKDNTEKCKTLLQGIGADEWNYQAAQNLLEELQ